MCTTTIERLEHLHDLSENGDPAYASEVKRIREEEPEVFALFVASVRELYVMGAEEADEEVEELLGIEVPPSAYVPSLAAAEKLVLFSAGLDAVEPLQRTTYAPCHLRDCHGEARAQTIAGELLCPAHVLPDEPLETDWRTEAERGGGPDASYLADYLRDCYPGE